MDEEVLAYTQEVMYEMLQIIARHIGGDCTLNQIRVLQYVNLCTLHRRTSTSHAEICAALGMSSATVSRSVAKFLETGMVQEQIDPADGRRRLIGGTGNIPGSPGDLDRELAEMAERRAREKDQRE